LQNKSKEFCEVYRRANPIPLARAKVPVLEVIGDQTNFALCESLVVADYIAERYPNVGLIPTNSVEDRATMRLFVELFGSSFSYWNILRSQGDEEKFQLAIEEFKQGLINVNAFLEKMGDSSRGPFLFGDQFSLAECNTAPFLQRACNVLPVFTGGTNSVFVDPIKFCDEQDLSRLKTWIMAVLARPSVKATELPKEEMIQSVTKMLKRFAEMEKK
jgi:glutathione S-transferase